MLANDELIQVLHQFLRSKRGLIIFEVLEDLLQLGIFILATEAGLRHAFEEEVPRMCGLKTKGRQFPEWQHCLYCLNVIYIYIVTVMNEATEMSTETIQR